MRANPIEEIKELRAKSHRVNPVELSPGSPAVLPVLSNTFELTLEFDTGDSDQVFINIPGTHIRYRTKEQIIEHREIPLEVINGKVKMHILVDACLYEIAGNDGRVYVSLPRDYKLPITEIKIEAIGGNAMLTH